MESQPARCGGFYEWIRATSLSAVLLTGCSQTDPDGDGGTQPILKLAVTTSTHDSGLLDVLVPVFEEEFGVRVDVIAVGSGAALRLGEAGDVDAVLVHAREAEDAFMAAGHGVRREDVMYNTFEILGPNDDPAGIRGRDPAAALASIACSGIGFVSRGDESGTHQREKSLWAAVGGRPEWDAYFESGQGMGATLTIADNLNAYVLCDRGTYLRFKQRLRLVPLVTSTESLRNPYGILIVNPAKHPDVDLRSARQFVEFMISVEAQRLIRDHTIEGHQLFHPLHLPEQD